MQHGVLDVLMSCDTSISGYPFSLAFLRMLQFLHCPPLQPDGQWGGGVSYEISNFRDDALIHHSTARYAPQELGNHMHCLDTVFFGWQLIGIDRCSLCNLLAAREPQPLHSSFRCLSSSLF